MFLSQVSGPTQTYSGKYPDSGINIHQNKPQPYKLFHIGSSIHLGATVVVLDIVPVLFVETRVEISIYTQQGE